MMIWIYMEFNKVDRVLNIYDKLISGEISSVEAIYKIEGKLVNIL